MPSSAEVPVEVASVELVAVEEPCFDAVDPPIADVLVFVAVVAEDAVESVAVPVGSAAPLGLLPVDLGAESAFVPAGSGDTGSQGLSGAGRVGVGVCPTGVAVWDFGVAVFGTGDAVCPAGVAVCAAGEAVRARWSRSLWARYSGFHIRNQIPCAKRESATTEDSGQEDCHQHI